MLEIGETVKLIIGNSKNLKIGKSEDNKSENGNFGNGIMENRLIGKMAFQFISCH